MTCSFWGGLPPNSKLRKRVITQKPLHDKTDGKAKRYGMCDLSDWVSIELSSVDYSMPRSGSGDFCSDGVHIRHGMDNLVDTTPRR